MSKAAATARPAEAKEERMAQNYYGSEYKTKIWGETITMTANWGNANDTIYFNGAPSKYQVADFQHSPEEAMKQYIIEELVRPSGENPEDEDTADDIQAAIDSMD